MRHLIPKRIKIGKDKWRILIVSEERLEEVAAKHGFFGDYDGFCLFAAKEIYISEDLEGVDLIDTLTHELLHALHHTHNFKMPHSLVYALGTHGGRLLWDDFLKKRRLGLESLSKSFDKGR